MFDFITSFTRLGFLAYPVTLGGYFFTYPLRDSLARCFVENIGCVAGEVNAVVQYDNHALIYDESPSGSSTRRAVDLTESSKTTCGPVALETEITKV